MEMMNKFIAIFNYGVRTMKKCSLEHRGAYPIGGIFTKSENECGWPVNQFKSIQSAKGDKFLQYKLQCWAYQAFMSTGQV